MHLLSVYVTNASLNVNRPFTYCSEAAVEKYCRVKVVFHMAANTAIVVDCKYTDKDKDELKEELGYDLLDIIEVIDDEPVFNDELYELAAWLSRTTISPFISCLNTMLPKTLKTRKETIGPKMVRKIKRIIQLYSSRKGSRKSMMNFITA